jgi:hypothetical protein
MGRDRRRGGSRAAALLLGLWLAAGCAAPEGAPHEAVGAGGAVPEEPGTTPPDSALARAALERYWESLSAGRYGEAAALHGGDWREVEHWVDPAGRDTLSAEGFLARVCGGLLVCGLRVGEVVAVEPLEAGAFRLTVTLVEAGSGRAFQRGPCCGEEGEPQTEFRFDVRRHGDRFLVDDLPIYVP